MKSPITIIANAQISYKSMGGSDKIFIEMARIWKNSDHPLTILGCREAGKMCRDSELGDNFREVSRFDVQRLGLFISYTLRTAFSFFRGSMVKIGALYSSSDFFPDLIFAFWQKLLNKKIKWIAGIFLISPNPFKVKYAKNFKGMIYWLSQLVAVNIMRIYADLIVVLCQEDKEFLLKKGLKEDEVLIISGGIDLDVINKIPPQTRKYDASFVGRFHGQKGIPELIQIWKKVTLQLPDAKLAIVGWGDKYWINLINNIVTKYHLQNNIALLGFLDGEEKYKVLKASKIFVFPSSYESWGIVVAEAFGCGCPAVAFDIAATRKFKQGIVVVRRGDLDSFATAIINLIKDEHVYCNFSQAARETAKEFSWQSSAKSLIAAIHKINV